MFSSQKLALSQLSSRDQELFQQLLNYSSLTNKEEKLELFTKIFQLDQSQVILKVLARETDSQTAFNFTLWMIDRKLVTLNWIYDIAYQISTQPVQINLDLRELYPSGKRMSFMDFSVIIGQTELALKALRLDDVDVKQLVQDLEPSVAVSLQTWLLTFGKITLLDLNYLTDILSRMHPKDTVIQPEPEPAPITAAEESLQTALTPDNPLQEKTLEDIVIELNLQLGGSETELFPRVLDRLLFRKIRDPQSGHERVIFRPTFQAIQYKSDGTNHREDPMPIKSAKTWPPGVFLIQNDKDYIQVMRLPGQTHFEIFPEGPDPFIRAMTIERMVREGQGN